MIGAGALMCEANGLDPDAKANLREPMVELIKITEGFYACGVAASVYATRDEHSGSFMPDPVFSNIGKLLLATQIYDMHRLAHEVSGGLIVALPGPDEDHNPATAARLSEALQANPAVPYDRRIQTARFIEDLTASYQGGWYSVISLHGGGSPAAMKQEIWRNYPLAPRWNWWNACWSGACCTTRRARPRRTASPDAAATWGAARRASPSWCRCPRSSVDRRKQIVGMHHQLARQPAGGAQIQHGLPARVLPQVLPQRFEHARVGRLAGGQQGGVGQAGRRGQQLHAAGGVERRRPGFVGRVAAVQHGVGQILHFLRQRAQGAAQPDLALLRGAGIDVRFGLGQQAQPRNRRGRSVAASTEALASMSRQTSQSGVSLALSSARRSSTASHSVLARSALAARADGTRSEVTTR